MRRTASPPIAPHSLNAVLTASVTPLANPPILLAIVPANSPAFPAATLAPFCTGPFAGAGHAA